MGKLGRTVWIHFAVFVILLALPAGVRGQFVYSTNHGVLTITE
jgi:hypothetical protein